MPRKSRQKKNPVVMVLRSGPFLCAVVGAVLLGASSLGKVWHENRNVLLERDIRLLDRQLLDLRRSLVDLRVQEAQALSPAGIQRRLAELELDLAPPVEAQILRLDEPDWSARLADHARPGPPNPPMIDVPPAATLATAGSPVLTPRRVAPGEVHP